MCREHNLPIYSHTKNITFPHIATTTDNDAFFSTTTQQVPSAVVLHMQLCPCLPRVTHVLRQMSYAVYNTHTFPKVWMFVVDLRWPLAIFILYPVVCGPRWGWGGSIHSTLCLLLGCIARFWTTRWEHTDRMHKGMGFNHHRRCNSTQQSWICGWRKVWWYGGGWPRALTLCFRYVCGGDEHGVLNAPSIEQRLKVGDQVLLVPGHCDPTVNLHDYFMVMNGDAKVEAVWPISGRSAGL